MSDTRPENFSSVWADLKGVAFKQHYIDADGVRTRCVESGDPSKPLVLALHGVGGHAEAYSRNFGPRFVRMLCVAKAALNQVRN